MSFNVNLSSTSGLTTIGSTTPLSVSSAGVVTINNTTASTTTTSGALIVSGGLGVAGALYSASGNFTGAVTAASANITTLSAPHLGLTGLLNDDHTQYALLAGRAGGQILTAGTASGNSLTLRSTTNATKGRVIIDETTVSSSTTTGALVVSGGVGIAGSLYTGLIVNPIFQNTGTANTGTTIGTFKNPAGTDRIFVIDETTTGSVSPGISTTSGFGLGLFSAGSGPINFYTTGSNTLRMSISNAGALTVSGSATFSSGLTSTAGTTTLGTTFAPTITGSTSVSGTLTLRSTTNATKGRVIIDETTVSSSTTTGALTVGGGVGIVGPVYIGNSLNVVSQNTVKLPDINITNGFINNLNIRNIYNRTTVSYYGNTLRSVSSGWYQSTSSNPQARSIAWSPYLGIIVIVGIAGARVITSSYGVTWTDRTAAASNTWNSVCWSPELFLFVAVASSGTNNRVMTSADGITWASRTSAADNSWNSICWSPELTLFVAVASTGTNNRVMTSSDGITWATRTSAANNSWNSVCWSPELTLFVAVASTGTGNRVMTSPDGITWTTRTSAADNDWNSVCWSPELTLFVAVASTGTGNRVMTSSDGITWTTRTSAADNSWTSICWSPELTLFVAVAFSGINNRFMISPNGITWVTVTSPADVTWRNVIWIKELSRFITCNSTSTDCVYLSQIVLPDNKNTLLISGNRLSIDETGILTSTTSAASTSSTTGSILVSGGIGISNTTDATSSTNGGTFTTAGGIAVAKKAFIGTDLSVLGITTLGATNSMTISAAGAVVVNGSTTFNALTASLPVALNASKVLITSPVTGTGSTVVLDTSPSIKDSILRGTGALQGGTNLVRIQDSGGSNRMTLIDESLASSLPPGLESGFGFFGIGLYATDNTFGSIGLFTTSSRTRRFNIAPDGTISLGTSNSMTVSATGAVTIQASAVISNATLQNTATANTGTNIATFRNSASAERLFVIDEVGSPDNLPAGINNNGDFGLGLYSTSTGPIRFYTTSSKTLRMTIANDGVVTIPGVTNITNTTTSTSNTTGSLTLSGGIGISNTTDATSSTNGGTFTTAGGIAVAKKLFVGGQAVFNNQIVEQYTLQNITTSSAVTYTASQVIGSIIFRDGIFGSPWSDTLPSAANLVGAFSNPAVGLTWSILLRNLSIASGLNTGSGGTFYGSNSFAINTYYRITFVLTNVSNGTEAYNVFMIPNQ